MVEQVPYLKLAGKLLRRGNFQHILQLPEPQVTSGSSEEYLVLRWQCDVFLTSAFTYLFIYIFTNNSKLQLGCNPNTPWASASPLHQPGSVMKVLKNTFLLLEWEIRQCTDVCWILCPAMGPAEDHIFVLAKIGQ